MTNSSSLRRVLRPMVAPAGLLIALSTALVTLPAQAAGTRYVALGDSFSSGVGAHAYDDDGTDCARSPKSYGALIADRRHLDLTLAACSGATTADVLTECALPGWAGNCDGAVDGGLAVLRTSPPGRVDAVLAEIVARAPHAAVVFAGYPHLFTGEDCNAATFLPVGRGGSTLRPTSSTPCWPSA